MRDVKEALLHKDALGAVVALTAGARRGLPML